MENVPYSMDFTGADRLEVSEADHSKGTDSAHTHRIVDQETIQKFTELLAQLPRSGDKMKKMEAGVVHTVIAYKGEQPFAQIEFYDGKLKTENTAFLVEDEGDPIAQKEQELFALLRS